MLGSYGNITITQINVGIKPMAYKLPTNIFPANMEEQKLGINQGSKAVPFSSSVIAERFGKYPHVTDAERINIPGGGYNNYYLQPNILQIELYVEHPVGTVLTLSNTTDLEKCDPSNKSLLQYILNYVTKALSSLMSGSRPVITGLVGYDYHIDTRITSGVTWIQILPYKSVGGINIESMKASYKQRAMPLNDGNVIIGSVQRDAGLAAPIVVNMDGTSNSTLCKP